VNYRFLQPKWFLEKIERFHFLSPTTRFQWWYFDLVLEDGAIIIIAFVPQLWWPSDVEHGVSTSRLFVSLRHTSGTVERWVVDRPSREFKLSDGHAEIADIFSLNKEDGEYHLSVRLPEVKASVQVKATVAPFAASPFGVLPLWLLRLFSQKRLPLSYASLVPRGRARVQLQTSDVNIDQIAMAYHEQGRFEGEPSEFQLKEWAWFHVVGTEWSIFGAEDTFIHITDGHSTIQRGFPMQRETYILSEKQYLENDSRVLQKAALFFKTSEISLNVLFEPSREENLTHWSSADARQLWCIRRATARVHIEHAGKIHDFSAPALLETFRCR